MITTASVVTVVDGATIHAFGSHLAILVCPSITPAAPTTSPLAWNHIVSAAGGGSGAAAGAGAGAGGGAAAGGGAGAGAASATVSFLLLVLAFTLVLVLATTTPVHHFRPFPAASGRPTRSFCAPPKHSMIPSRSNTTCLLFCCYWIKNEFMMPPHTSSIAAFEKTRHTHTTRRRRTNK